MDIDIADIIVNIMVINVAVGDVIDGVFVFEQTCCGDWGNLCWRDEEGRAAWCCKALGGMSEWCWWGSKGVDG